MPRTARQRTVSGIHHVIVQGPDHQRIFEEDEQKLQYLSTIRRYHARGCIHLYAFCILNNSAHLLIGERSDDVSAFMRRTGIAYVHWYNKEYGRKGPLFRDRYASEPVRTEEELLKTVRFIHQLPVRYGLTKVMSSYKWSSYKSYLNRDRRMDIEKVMNELAGWDYERYMRNSWRDRFLQEKTTGYRSRRKKTPEDCHHEQ